MKVKRQKYKLLFVVSFWCVLFSGLTGAALLLLAPKQPRESERENRYLAGFPEWSAASVADGSFMSGFESYLADGFFGRDALVDASKRMLRLFSTLSAEEQLEDNGDLEQELEAFLEGEDAAADAAEPDVPAADAGQTPGPELPQDSPEPAEAADTGAVAADLSGMQKKYTFWKENTDGTRDHVYSFPIENIASVAQTLNAYRAELPEDGTVVFLQVPYPQIARALRLGTASGWGSDMEQAMQTLCAGGVTVLSGTEILEQPLLDNAYVYFRTDHHWSLYGAYLAAAAVARAQGVPPVDYRDFAYTIKNGFIGSFAKDQPGADLSAQADTLELLHPAAPAESLVIRDPKHPEDAEALDLIGYERRSYTAFLYGTRGPWRRIVTGFETGRNALVITDSYGNAFAPYLLPYYSEVHMVDLRPDYFTKRTAGATVAEYMGAYGITDVIVLLSTASSVNSSYMLSYMPSYLH